MEQRIKADVNVLVIGTGQTGLFAAIMAAQQDVSVTLADKGHASKAS